jgi:hypothetical protein
MSDQDTDRIASPANGDAVPAQGAPQRPRQLLLSLAAVAVVVACAQPLSATEVGGRPSFVPAMLALVCCLDLLSAVLLVRHFRDAGDRRALLASAYVFSMAVLAGYGAAFPGAR